MATSERPEARWRPARLISAYGIKGETEQEQRAVSALLAVMVAVPDFGRDLLSRLGAPAGKLSAYSEVRFDGEVGKSLRPDGALVVERGQTRWSCQSRGSGGTGRRDAGARRARWEGRAWVI